MKNKIILLLLITVVFSCGEHNKFKSNEKLIAFDINYDVKDKKFEDQNPINLRDFNPQFDTVKYSDGEIYVSCLTYVVGCSEYVGDVRIEKDSIELNLKNIGDEYCTEAPLARLTYRIKNPKNIRYKIVKKVFI